MSGDWRVLIADTLSGLIRTEVEPNGVPTFSREINEKGQIQVSAQLSSRPNRPVDFHTYTRPGMYSWVVAYHDHIVQAGPVWTYQISDADRTISVTCGGLASLFDRRVTRNPTGHTAIVHPSEDLHYTGLSLRGIMRALAADNMAQARYALPVVLPASEAGDAERNYFGYDLKPVLENMTQLAEVINGPDFDFAPEFTADGNSIRWRLDIGDPLLGDQATSNVWDYGTERAPINSLDVDVDGSAAPVTRVWVKGEGNERALLTGFAEDTSLSDLGYPATDYVNGDHATVTEQSTLEDYADSYLKEFRLPTEKWSCDVRIQANTDAEYGPALGNWSLGDAPQFAVDNHPWLTSGTYRRRVVGYANGTNPGQIKLTLAETPESGNP